MICTMYDKLYNSFIEFENQDFVLRIPVKIIADSHAAYYSKYHDNDIEKCLNEETLPLFFDDNFEINDWVENSMSYDDLKDHVIVNTKVRELDYFDIINSSEGYKIVDNDLNPM